MTIKQLKRLCREWQRRLRLQDVDIDLELIDSFPNSPTQTGDSVSRLQLGIAQVRIKKGLSDHTTELTLVHELLHVRIPLNVAEDSTAQFLLEVGVENLAKALIEMKGSI